eukprot:gene12434-biopygen5395
MLGSPTLLRLQQAMVVTSGKKKTQEDGRTQCKRQTQRQRGSVNIKSTAEENRILPNAIGAGMILESWEQQQWRQSCTSRKPR